MGGGPDLERERLELERHRLELEIDRVGFDAAHSFAKDGIRHLILINGAAVVALLAFLGHDRVGSTGTTDTGQLALAMILFGAGVATGAICALLAYLFQTVEREGQEWVRARKLLRYSAVGAALSGVAFFVAGLLVATCAFASA